MANSTTEPDLEPGKPQLSVAVDDSDQPPPELPHADPPGEAETPKADEFKVPPMGPPTGFYRYTEPTPPPRGASTLVQEAHSRSVGYLDKLRALPYHTDAITYSIKAISDRCEVKTISLHQRGSSVPTYVESIQDLELSLQALVDKHADKTATEDYEMIVAREPSPEVIRALGGYLQVPVEFFASHAATGAIIHVYEYDENYFGDGKAGPDYTKNRMFSKKSSARSRARDHCWSSLEFRRAAVLNPVLLDKSFADSPGSISLAFHDAGGEMCLPYDFFESRKTDSKLIPPAIPHWTIVRDDFGRAGVRAREITVENRILRPCWALGQSNHVMFQQRVSIFKRSKGGVRCVLFLVDRLPMFGDENSTQLYTSVHSGPSQDNNENSSHKGDFWDMVEQNIQHLIRDIYNDSEDPVSLSVNALEKLLYHEGAHFSHEVLRYLGNSLDTIDRGVSNNALVRTRLDHWRYLFGVWRSVLPRMLEELSLCRAKSKRLEAYNLSSPADLDDLQLVETYDSLIESCRALQERVERSSQAQMSTMSILESQNAIQQGRDMQRLTELAFFFIPLGFVASVFGMEIVDFDENKPTLKLFLTIGISLVCGLYALRLLLSSYTFQQTKKSIQNDFENTVGERNRKHNKTTTGLRPWVLYVCRAIHRNAMLTAATAFSLEILPLVLLWNLQPPGWPGYISLSISLVWSWVVLLSWNRVAVTSSDWEHTPFCSELYLSSLPKNMWPQRLFWSFTLAVHGYTVAFAPLMIYVGGLTSAGPGNDVRLALAVIIPFIVLMLLLVFMNRLRGALYGGHGENGYRFRAAGLADLWNDFKLAFGLTKMV